MNEFISVKGVRGRLNANGDPELNLEDVARGLGFTTIATSGNECVRWNRVKKYLDEFSFGSSAERCFSQQVGKDDFIPENIFYKLCFKASNEVARAFQDKVTNEILPTIRKTGAYIVKSDNIPTLTAATGYIRELRKAMEKQGSTPQEITSMIALVCQHYKLPLPSNFVKESPYEQLTLTLNIGRVTG